jgi:hypothetical protein
MPEDLNLFVCLLFSFQLVAFKQLSAIPLPLKNSLSLKGQSHEKVGEIRA